MLKNTEITENKTEIYIHQVFLLADQYIQEQLEGDTEKVPEYFRDMIFYISDRIECPDHADIGALDNLFDTFVRLCTRYKKLPTLSCFSFLTKINRATFADWNNREYRSSTGHSNAVQKWKDTCKNFVIDELSNSKKVDPNLIFVAKSCHGLIEAVPEPTPEPQRRFMTMDQLPDLRKSKKLGETNVY